jgi:hypothetical protein
MARRCTVCDHLRREEIDRQLICGEPYRNIAERFSLSLGSIARHKESHIPAALVEAQEAGEVAQADDLLSQVKALQSEAQSILGEARAAGDLKTALMGIGKAKECLELLFKVEGRLQDQQSVQVNVNLDIFHSPEWRQVGAMLAEVLAPYPDLRGEIAARLKVMVQVAEAGQ